MKISLLFIEYHVYINTSMFSPSPKTSQIIEAPLKLQAVVTFIW